MQKNGFESTGTCGGIFFVIFLVPFLFVAALAAGYLGFLPFKVEIHTLVTITLIFVVFLFFIRHNASYSACRIRHNFALMEDRLQDALKTNALSIMGQTKSTLTVRDFAAEYFKDIRDDNYAKVASSIFPMLGILGTFVAIAMSMPDFTVSSGDKLDHEISVLLSGIGTAFYASIYGIFLSLWWIFFERRGLASIEKNTQKLEKIYGDKIWKKSELIKHEHAQAELKDQKIIQTLKETFSLDFIRELNEQYIKNYKTIIDDTTNSFEMLSRHMHNASQDLRNTLLTLDNREESVNAVATIKETIEQFTQSAQTLNQNLSHFDQSVGHTFTTFDQELAQSVSKLGEMSEALARHNALIAQQGTKEA
jgi:membrane protein implicated in regulation of membrane protease activity